MNSTLAFGTNYLLLFLIGLTLTPKYELFYSNLLILTPTFEKVPIERYGKTPNFLEDSIFTAIFKILVKTLQSYLV